MTFTITLPDEAAGRFQRAADARGLGLPAFAVALMDEASEISETDNHALIDLMSFAGVGHGRPGAISKPGGDGSEVDSYIRAMRDEWDTDDAEGDSEDTEGVDGEFVAARRG